MNRQYKPILSDYYKALNLYLKMTAKEKPCKSIFERTQNFINLCSKELESHLDDDYNKTVISSAECKAFINDLNHHIPHVYIQDDSLINFLKSLEIKDMKLAESFIENNDKPELKPTELKLTSNKEQSAENSVMGFIKDFFSRENINTSYYAVHSADESYLIITVRDNLKKNASIIIFDDNKNYNNFKLNSKDIDFIAREPMAKFAINFLAYIQAFPECLQNGVPDDISKKSIIEIKNSKTLKTADAVIEIKEEQKNNETVMIPHFRRGHFRFLKDERYVNKKGQVIFVRSSMVKGHAKTLNKKDINTEYTL